MLLNYYTSTPIKVFAITINRIEYYPPSFWGELLKTEKFIKLNFPVVSTL